LISGGATVDQIGSNLIFMGCFFFQADTPAQRERHA
jgi:hypothetical protein